MEDAFEPRPEVTFQRSLYLAGSEAVQEAVLALPDTTSSVLLLGHNFGWEQVVQWLCGDEVSLTTANAALLSAHGETWEEALVTRPSWTLHQVLRPKEL